MARGIATRLRSFLFDKNTLQTARLSVGAGLATLITFVVAPVLTRIFGPDTLGLFGVFSAVLSILALAATGRFDLAVPVPAGDAEAAGLYRLSIRCALAAGLATTCLIPWRNQLAGMLGHPELGSWFFALPPALVLAAWAQSETAWATRRQAFGLVSTGRACQAAASCGLQIALSFAGWIALPAGVLAGLAVQIGLMQKIRPSRELARRENQIMLARKYRRFPLYTLPTGLLDVLTMQLPLLLGGFFFGSAFVGFYALSSKLLGLPAALLGGPAGQVFYREFANRLNTGENARTLIFSTWLKLAAAGALPFLALSYAGPWLFAHIFGATWQGAGDMSAVLAPMFFIMLVSSPTSGAMLVLGGQRVSAVFSLCFPVYRLTCLWLGYREDDPLLSLALLALAEIVTILIFNLILLRRLSVRSDEFTP